MADIFVSYSTKDRDYALRLTEALKSAGLSVWIDRSGLDVAASWSRQIVDAIDECRVFVVLISPNSNASPNVLREVSLASSKRKPMLPVQLERVALTQELQYHLAGIQYARGLDSDAILRGLEQLGISLAISGDTQAGSSRQVDKRLMVLPFDDLSPQGDHLWFADGIVNDLISALSGVHSLDVSDTYSTRGFRSYKGSLSAYAHEQGIRYFVQGDVRKFGEQVKISVRLLDIDTGKILWQDSLRGTMDDIFEIQDEVSSKVLTGLDVVLTREETKRLGARKTKNSTAYEYFLKGQELYYRHGAGDIERAIEFFASAVEHDPEFYTAMAAMANAHLMMHEFHDPSERRMAEARRIAQVLNVRAPESPDSLWLSTIIAMRDGDIDTAERLARLLVERYDRGYDNLARVLHAKGDVDGRIEALIRYADMVPVPNSCHNLLVALYDQGRSEELRYHARRLRPVIERHLHLYPEDTGVGVMYADILYFEGAKEAATTQAVSLLQGVSLPAQALHTLACLFCDLGEKEHAAAALLKSIQAGLSNLGLIDDVLHIAPDLLENQSLKSAYEALKRSRAVPIAEASSR